MNSEKMYKLKPWIDAPIIAVCAGWSAFGFTKIYSKENSTEQEILDLKKSDIPKFDRWAAGMSDENADAVSDLFFYGSIPVPFTLLFDKKIRKDAGKVGLMWLEAMSITGLFYTGTVYFVDRYRPETYDLSIPVDDRKSGNYKDAFMAGHPALVATGTFFTAKVFADYNPDSKLKYGLYGLAIVATGTTVYLRHIAGKHFPSDLITGTTIGVLSGMLVPQFHKTKAFRDNKLGFMPFMYGKTRGLTLVYRPD
jgi:membrane-associated phospholipid phosphatase